MKSNKKFTKNDYRNSLEPTWCKGCSFFSVLSALTEVFQQRQLDPLNTNVISGIGCSSRLSLYLNTFGMHTLHGRSIPVAVGAHLAKPDSTVVVIGGDGDLFSIGIGHFVHAARKNFNITVLCLDNRMYAMTKNQASPTSSIGYRGSLTPYGKISVPLNVLELAISCEATFVSRTFAGNINHMNTIINAALEHEGFSFVEIIAPCKTFEFKTPLTFFKDRLIDINSTLRHNPHNKTQALSFAAKAFEYDEHKNASIPIGVFWENKTNMTFESQVKEIKDNSKRKSVKQILEKFRIE